MIKIHKSVYTALHILIIFALAAGFYWRSVQVFFYADDFVWLDRAKHIAGNWLSVFNKENTYFTPFTYLSFVSNYRLSGLDPFWFHVTDIILHTVNGVLLYLLAFRISANRMLSFFAGVVFVTSSSIVYAVIWPSARPDTVFTLMSLAVCITWLKYPEGRLRFVPVLLYLLALCAKGTAIVVPLLLLLVLAAREGSWKRNLARVGPYFLITAVYAALIIAVNFFGSNKFADTHHSLSFINYLKAIPLLVIPERYLYGLERAGLIFISTLVISALIYLNVKLKSNIVRLGTAVALLGIIPLAFTREYFLAGMDTPSIRAFTSPSNRMYFSCAGMALVFGALLTEALGRCRSFLARGIWLLVIAGVLYFNYTEIAFRTAKWSRGASGAKRGIETLKKYSGILDDNSQLLLFNFEGSPGFNRAMFRTWFNFNNIELHSFGANSLDEFTTIETSPLSHPDYNSNPAKLKLIMDCSNSRNEDHLNLSGNKSMQNLLTDFRTLNAGLEEDKAAQAKERVANEMLTLREILTLCTEEVPPGW